MKYCLKLFLKELFISKKLVLSFLFLVTSCGTMMSMIDDAQNDEKEQAIIEKIQNDCQNADEKAFAYEKQSPGERTVEALSAASRSLSICRERIESSLQPYFSGSLNKKVTDISKPDEAKLELDGKTRSIKEVYRTMLAREKKLTTLPLDLCMERRGNFTAKGFGGNWEPYVLTMTDWKGADCKLTQADAYITSSISSSEKAHLQKICPGAVIRSSDIEMERQGVNLAKKWSRVWCQKSKERKTGVAFLELPKVDERCEACKRWSKTSK